MTDQNVEPMKPLEPMKPKRQPSKFAQFVKDNYSKVRDLPNKERMKRLSQMYKESKSKQ